MREEKTAPTLQPRFCTREVRRHYAHLAPLYRTKANVACARAYARLVTRTFAGCAYVLEIGAGSSPVLGQLPAARKAACDFSLPMFAAERRPRGWPRVAADAQALPFPDSTFDGVVSVNLLEHLPDPATFVREAARVLTPGGRFLAVTPNGDAEWLLDLLERWRMKLPEGPHRFIGFLELEELAGRELRTLEHRAFLAFPAGPPALVEALDRLLASRAGRGLFQFVLCEKASGERV